VEAGFDAALAAGYRPLVSDDPGASRFDRLDPARLRRRRGEKWALHPPDVLPAWVAEMDFPVAEPVQRALREALDLDDLGYPINPRPGDLPAVFAARMEQRFGWRVDPHDVEVLSDVVQGLYVAIDRFSAPGEGIVVQTPVYPPFLHAVRDCGRRRVESPLVRRPGGSRYEIDFDHLRSVLDPGSRVLLLCNPQNPTGRAFERAELEALAALALSHELVVVADEIHADLVHDGRRHLPFASLSPEVAARTITLTSATKAFNIPGLRCAVAHFGSAALRRRFLGLPRPLRGGIGSFGLLATAVAWSEGQPWLDEVLRYLAGNRDWVAARTAESLPGVVHLPPEAGFLAWLDCRALGLGPSPQRFFLEHARVALSAGESFGRPGEGFVRLNFATSRAILGEIVERMAKALRERGPGPR
jgi:cystathionine beta-lyase